MKYRECPLVSGTETCHWKPALKVTSIRSELISLVVITQSRMQTPALAFLRERPYILGLSPLYRAVDNRSIWTRGIREYPEQFAEGCKQHCRDLKLKPFSVSEMPPN